MAQEKKTREELSIERIYEQPADAVSFYTEIAQVFSTSHETIIQFYENIPGPPDREGRITKSLTRLRATITLSHSHAGNLGKLLVEKSKKQKGQK